MKGPVSDKRNANWFDELPEVLVKYDNNTHSSTKMTPLVASIKSKENEVDNNIRDKRRKRKPKFTVGDLVRTSNLRDSSYKGDTTNWSYDLYAIKKL